MIHQYFCSSPSPETLLQEAGVLTVIAYNAPCGAPAVPGVIPVGLTGLSPQQYEVIQFGKQPVERGIGGRCHWNRNATVTCVATWLTPAECEDIENTSYSAYAELLNFLQDSGHPHPFRIWNFLPRINEGDGDLEEYKKFCIGRLNAFTELGMPPEQFPAASALGNQSKGAVIYALASAAPGQQHENPKQYRAYHYPRQYGPSSPSFSRATSIQVDNEKLLFISGTSSILGHQTQAAGDFASQLDITLGNIQTLLEQSHATKEQVAALRVYLRDPNHLVAARQRLDGEFPTLEINYALANICRKDLLVEIEATVRCQS